MTDSFEAVVLEEYGPPSVLRAISFPLRPLPPGNAHVQIAATTVNNVDLQVRSGRLGTGRPLPHALGPDMVGKVVESSDPTWIDQMVVVNPSWGCGHCSECARGRFNLCADFQIIGEHSFWGGYSSIVTAPIRNLIPLPAGIPVEVAACLPVTFGTAWRLLSTQANTLPGDRVLVMGAGGGIAVAARRIAALLGAEVHVAARPSERLNRAAADDAVTAWPIRDDELDQAHRALRAAGRFDVVVDSAGGPWFAAGLRVLRPGGVLVTCGSTLDPYSQLDIRQIFWKQTSVRGATGGFVDDIRRVLDLTASGHLSPVIDRVLPVHQAAAAHEAAEGGEVYGKVVLKWDDGL